MAGPVVKGRKGTGQSGTNREVDGAKPQQGVRFVGRVFSDQAGIEGLIRKELGENKENGQLPQHEFWSRFGNVICKPAAKKNP